MEHPITPPTPPCDLVKLWLSQWVGADTTLASYIATRAAQWGWVQRGAATESELQQRADQELEACCKWLDFYSSANDARDLRAARRPKLPSKAESALNALEHILRHSQTDHGANTIRLALEQLKKLEALDD